MPSSGTQLQIEFSYDPERYQVESRQEGDVWYYRQTSRRKHIRSFFRFGPGHSDIAVLVPESFHGSLLLRTQNARISGSGLPSLARLEASSTNGALRLNKVQADTCCLKTTNASIHLQDFSGSTLDVQSSNGALDGEEIHCTRQSWETSNGAIHLTNMEASSLSASTSNNRIVANSCRGNDMAFTSSNGSISFEQAEGESLRFRTSNGAISGTVCGNPEDYRIEAIVYN